MIKTRALAAALTAGAIAALVAVLPAHGQDTAQRADADLHQHREAGRRARDRHPAERPLGRRPLAARIHAPPSGQDRRTTRGRLRRHRQDLRRPPMHRHRHPRNGRLTLHGASVSKPIPGVGGTGEEYAITGGTGAYQGATGTMRAPETTSATHSPSPSAPDAGGRRGASRRGDQPPARAPVLTRSLGDHRPDNRLDDPHERRRPARTRLLSPGESGRPCTGV